MLRVLAYFSISKCTIIQAFEGHQTATFCSFLQLTTNWHLLSILKKDIDKGHCRFIAHAIQALFCAAAQLNSDLDLEWVFWATGHWYLAFAIYYSVFNEVWKCKLELTLDELELKVKKKTGKARRFWCNPHTGYEVKGVFRKIMFEWMLKCNQFAPLWRTVQLPFYKISKWSS